MKIAPRVKQGEKTGFAIDWGHGTAGKNKAADYLHGRDLSDAEALEIYQLVLKAGFFEKKDRYAPKDIEFGGSTTTVSITANGKTKEVFIASGAEVPEIKKLITAVSCYQLKVGRK